MQSEQAWHGLKSCKFNYSEVNLIQENQKFISNLKIVLQILQEESYNSHQEEYKQIYYNFIIYFDPKYGDPYSWVPHLKTKMPRQGDSKSQEFPLGKQFIEHHPQEKKPRTQRVHLKEGISGHIEDVPYGIKTFPPIHCKKRHEIEEMMGKKQRLEYLYQMRNGLPIALCNRFFQRRRINKRIMQYLKKSKHQLIARKRNRIKIKLIQSRIKKETLWSDKVKMDQDAEKQQDIEDLDTGIKTTLKPSNLNYQDPNKFFENLEKQQAQDPKNAQVNQKKAGKK